MTKLPIRRVLLAVFALCVIAPRSLPQQAGSASIEGIVAKLGTNDPIPGAVVELSKPGGTTNAPSEIQKVTTGDDGKFAFRNLQPGEYRLVATRAGGTYNPGKYGQRDPQSPGTPLTLSTAQRMTAVRLEMAATGAISGHVYDRNGEPVPYARVLAMQDWYHEGNRLLDFVQAVQTNDRGEYRLFWLPPGRYYVAARPEDTQSSSTTTFVNTPDRPASYFEEVTMAPPLTRSIVDNEVVLETYRLTFYGGQTDPLKAPSLEVRPGITTPGIDIPLAAGTMRARKIQGTVINGATGQPAPGAYVSALPRLFMSSRIAPNATADANGKFTIGGLTSEAYNLHFRTAAGTGTGTLFGFLGIDAGTADLENLSLVAKPGVPITGKVSFDGRPASDNDPDLPRLQIAIVQDPGINGVPTPPPATVAGNGSFTVQNVGPVGWDFEIYVNGALPPSTYVKSIKLGTQDVLNAKYYPEAGESQRGGLHVDGPVNQPLEIVLGIGTGTIEGTALDDKQQPAPYRTVVLLPDVPLRHRFDLHLVTTSDTFGKFRLQNITPGSYKLFAFDRIDNGAWEDATVMQGFEGGGYPIRIQENGKESVELRIVR
jgi:Carboxypeptidase regulatory-like domain